MSIAGKWLSCLMLLALSGCVSYGPVQGKDDWTGPDKVKHFMVSAAIAAGTSATLVHQNTSACDAASAGISISLLIGAGKEYHDAYIRHTFWSWKDMLWGLAGGAFGSHLASGCF